MPKNKKKCGRPSKPQFPEEIEYEDEGYIATNEFSLELLQLITEMANYKLLTITGPAAGKKNEEKTIQELRNQKKKCLKNRKEIEKKQNKIRNELDIKEDKVFLLRNQDDNPRKYRLQNGQLIECGGESPNDISNNQNFNYPRNDFENSINRVCNELNKETSKIIKELVQIFLESDKSHDSFSQKFFQQFKLSSGLEYKEIKQWNELFEISFDEKLSLMQNEIDQFKEKYSLNSDNQESQRKVEQKRIEVLKTQQLNLDQFKNIKRPDRPLQLFIRRIFCLFTKFYDIEELTQ